MNPKLIKPLLIGAGVLITLVLIIWGFSKIVKLIKPDDSKDYLKQLEKEAREQDLQQTLSESESETIANSIFTALESYWVEEKIVFDKLAKIQNILDWSKVANAFGIRKISGNWSTSLESGNINEWLQDRLDTEEFDQASAILAKKGINI